MRPHTWFNRVLPLYSHHHRCAEQACVSCIIQGQERKWRSCSDCKNNSRRWKMSEKFADRQRKRILQCKHAETLKETWYQLLFDVFSNESIDCRMIQSYVKKRYVETVYAQWKLQVDWFVTTVSEYNARKNRTIGMRPINVTPAIVKQTLNDGAQSHKDRCNRAIQSGRLGTREQI